MSFLEKLFGHLKSFSLARVGTLVHKKTKEQGTIQVYDALGRLMECTRAEWLKNVLPTQIQKAWSNPEDLANVITQALEDGFFEAIEKAAARLYKIDPNPQQSAVLYAIVLLHTDRPAKAESILQQYLAAHGENALVMLNLAKAQNGLGRDADSLNTLWRALEIDPNLDNGLEWYESIFREKEGESGGLAALRRVAALSGSWRAQLGLARQALVQSNLDAAINYYRESLSRMGTPVPVDVLLQISGDLGKQGHLLELINMVLPCFQPKIHGISVGNNILKALLDTGQIDAAWRIIKALRFEQRPDWQQALDHWEDTLGKAALEIEDPIHPDAMKTTVLRLEYPIVHDQQAPTGALFSQKAQGAVRVAFLGATVQSEETSESGCRPQQSRKSGRFARALPLYLAEYFEGSTDARATVLLPWLLNAGGAFLLFSEAHGDDDASALARSDGEMPADMVVTAHLMTRGEHWTLQLRAVRTIDAKCLKSSEYKLSEWQPCTVLPQMQEDLFAEFKKEWGVSATGNPLPFVEGKQLDLYLFRLEQGLAVQCLGKQESAKSFLQNPWEIIQGMLELCADNPSNIRCRLLLLRTLSALNREAPDIVASYRQKVNFLQTEYPLKPKAHSLIGEELRQIFPE